LVLSSAESDCALTPSKRKHKIKNIVWIFQEEGSQPMRRCAFAVSCLSTVLACVAGGQNFVIEPVRVASGAVLTFHLQTRLHPNSENLPDVLPSGTILRVKVEDHLDSSVDHDGTEFHGVIISPVLSGSETIVHSDAEVQGILVLLRTKSHPDGFRYDLLITHLTDHGKSYSLTASLGTSFFEGAGQSTSTSTAGAK
jgi:hypothetical protein